MEKLFVIFASFVLASCALNPASNPIPKDLARASLDDCLRQAASEADDHYSPATSIAMGIISDCAPEFETYKKSIEYGMNYQTMMMFENKLRQDQDELKLATTDVLEERENFKKKK